jgi:uncharacterized membrane protein YccC
MSVDDPSLSFCEPRAFRSKQDQKEVLHSARTAVAAVGSLVIAQSCRLPEPYWAAVTTIVIMQSTLGAAWTVSKQRFAGTTLGAAMGALLTAYTTQSSRRLVPAYLCSE